jgi:hypothetical protein
MDEVRANPQRSEGSRQARRSRRVARTMPWPAVAPVVAIPSAVVPAPMAAGAKRCRRLILPGWATIRRRHPVFAPTACGKP